MKKTFYSWASMLILVIGALSLTSCDKDDMKAANLNGIWQGDFLAECSINGKKWHASYTTIEFHTTAFSNHGTGEQVDVYPSSCPVPYLHDYFDWSVEDGVLYIKYDNSAPVVIYNYRMSSRTFSGEKDESRYVFTLDKLTSDWSWNDSYYKAKERTSLNDSIAVE